MRTIGTDGHRPMLMCGSKYGNNTQPVWHSRIFFLLTCLHFANRIHCWLYSYPVAGYIMSRGISLFPVIYYAAWLYFIWHHGYIGRG